MQKKLDEVQGITPDLEEDEEELQVEISEVTFTGGVTINYSSAV